MTWLQRSMRPEFIHFRQIHIKVDEAVIVIAMARSAPNFYLKSCQRMCVRSQDSYMLLNRFPFCLIVVRQPGEI